LVLLFLIWFFVVNYFCNFLVSIFFSCYYCSLFYFYFCWFIYMFPFLFNFFMLLFCVFMCFFLFLTLCYFMVTSNPWLKALINLSDKGQRVKISLGDTTRNHLKECLRNQERPNHFSRPFILNVFTIINFFLMFINCMH
jgi:hypothetical protein